MHRCLAVQEILSIIFNSAYGYLESYPPLDARSSLANLAMTCRTFYEPAITVLWRCQASLVPLLRCIPDDAYSEQQHASGWSTIRLSRDPLPSDFDRIRFYAQKIKFLEIIDSEKDMSSPQAFALLLLHKPKFEPLLPYLLHVVLKDDLFKGAAILPRLILGPHLKKLDLLLQDDGDWWENVGAVISPCASTLKSFTLNECGADPVVDRYGMQLVQLYFKFRDLESLQTQGITLNSDAMIHISTLSSLRELDLCLADVDLLSLPRLSFHRLTKLTLMAITMANVATFLLATSFKDLHTICIIRDWTTDVDVPWTCQTFSEVLHSNHQNCPLVSITLLDEILCFFGAETSMTVMRADIEQLFVFPHISTFAINSCSTLHLDDALLIEMSKAWPDLQDLRLRDNRIDDNGPPSFTTAGVISFASSCFNLENLTLCFNAEETLNYANFDTQSNPPGLTRLDVCRSPISSTNKIAPLLVLAFPMLQELHFYGSVECSEECGCNIHSQSDRKWQQAAHQSEILRNLLRFIPQNIRDGVFDAIRALMESMTTMPVDTTCSGTANSDFG